MSFSWQLHLGDVGATLDVTFLLWFLIIFAMLSVQLQLTLIVFLLIILCSLFPRSNKLHKKDIYIYPSVVPLEDHMCMFHPSLLSNRTLCSL